MDVESLRERARAVPGLEPSNVPAVVAGVALVCWVLASNGVYVDRSAGAGVVFNPISYLTSMFLHFHWAHFVSNVRWWLPIGVVFTLLTSNRHVLLVAVAAHLSTQIVSSGLLRFVSGLSVVVFAVLTATLVRSIGVAFQNHSMETLQNALAVLLIPVLAGVFLIVIVVGPSWVGHLEHFFGALFGAAVESMYVLRDHESAAADQPVPERRTR
jgi:membrane associated rhomboid family serine protease